MKQKKYIRWKQQLNVYVYLEKTTSATSSGTLL